MPTLASRTQARALLVIVAAAALCAPVGAGAQPLPGSDPAPPVADPAPAAPPVADPAPAVPPVADPAPPAPNAADPKKPGIEIVEPTPAQVEMNKRAAQAVQRGELDSAIKLFQASIELGELNITYLNMGRTYQRMEECVRAKEAYRKARATRKKVSAPAPDVVAQKLFEYETELDQSCPNGELVMQCLPSNLELYKNTERVAGGCPDEERPLKLAAGEYVLRGELNGYQRDEVAVKIARNDQTRVTLKLLPKPAAPLVQAPPEKRPQDIVIKNEVKVERSPEEIADLRARAIEREERVQAASRARTAKYLKWGGSALILGGAFWDTCMGVYFYEKLDNERSPSNDLWCDHVYDGKRDAIDYAPAAVWGTGLVMYLVGALME